ncbi:hypothetical protein BJ944DRAFT_174834 [Cunninghamella echinulata]|nr:hypothetical protein BJ944DRAFT_174834 [Cunninghamella echinulata]
MAKKLSEIQRTASFAWSPGQQIPLIAAGTAAGALDDSFSNASELELFQLDLSSSKSDGLHVQHGLSPVGKINSPSRFNKLAWGYNTTEKPYGILAGGMENGELILWDPSAILNNKGEESLILRNSTHSGAIRGLDFNLHQSNLLASAGSNSQVYIWDLVNPDKPFTPGSRSMNMDDITNVGWNGQVSHILATTSNSGHTVVWDLRNKKEVMTLTYSGQNMGGISAGNRRGITTLAWHPDVATQLVTGAEDDNNPIITLWDLRHAHSPEKVLTGHQKGILSVSWCRQDADLLLSCGKDSRTLCWNPQSGELLGQVSQNSNWTFQADWCPRNPDLFATASFDGQVNVFSLQGAGDSQVPENQNKPTQADDPFSAAMLSAVPQTPSFALKHPPKWLRRPVGASFSFGGKLVTFNNKAGQAAAQAAAALPPGTTPALQNIPRNVSVINIVSDPEIAKKSDELEAALEYKNLQQLIDERRSQSINNKNTDEQESWEILRTLYDENARSQLLKHLGFSKDDVITTVNKLAVGKTTVSNGPSTTTADPSALTDNDNNNSNNVNGLQGSGFDSNKSGVSDLFGNGADNDFFIKSPGQSQQLNEAVTNLLPPVNQKPLELYPSTSSEMDRLITRAVVLGDFESAVNACLASERWSDALMFAICGGEDLLARTRLIYFEKQASSISYLRLLESVINSDLLSVVRNTELKEWDSIIAVLCTFARSEDFGTLSETLGARLEDAWATSKDINKGREYRRQATFCYLAAGNLEKVTGIWIIEQEEEEKLENDKNRGSSLQHLVEKVTVFRNAIGYEDIYLNDNTITHFPLGPLYQKYCQYAELLATQGKLATALKYLSLTPAAYQPSTNTFTSLPIIRDRIYRACGQKRGANQYPEPAFPFEVTQVVAEYSQTAFTGAAQQQQQQQSYASTNNNAYQPYTSNQPTTLSSNNYAPVTNPLSAGNNVYQPQTSNQYGMGQPQTNYSGNYSQPSVGYNNNNAYGTNAYGNTYNNVYDQPQQLNTVPPPPPMAGPPRQGSAISSPSRSGTPKLKNTSGAWNDPPMLPNPNITKSPRVSAASAGATKRVTSPFPNAPPSAAFVPPPQQQFMQAGPPQGNMGMVPPPPQQNTMVPPPPQQQTTIPPPPMNAMAPTPLAKQPPPPPPTQQQLQQQQQQLPQGLYNPSTHGFNAGPTPPPPMNAPPQQSPNMARPPPPQQNQYTPSPMNNNNNYAPNPYTPSPQQQHQQPQSFSQPPPSHHQRPPPPQQSFQQPFSPQQNFHQPPPPNAQQQFHPQQQQQALSQPPMNVNPSSPAPVAAKPAAPAIPEKQRHPKDDRSHIPPQQRPIFEILSGELQNQRQRSSPAQKKILDDTEKRLNGLFDNMNNSELSDDVVQSMLKLAQAVQTRDYNQAHRLQVELVTTRYAECGAWLVGVKRLIENAQKQNM